jgi:hypothetical protein
VTLSTAEYWKSACHQPRQRKKQTIASPPIQWKRQEDELICRVSLAEASRRTGRTLTAVRKRRRMLRMPDGRLAAEKAARTEVLKQQAAAACGILRARTESLSVALAKLQATLLRSKSTVAFWRTFRRQAASESVSHSTDE